MTEAEYRECMRVVELLMPLDPHPDSRYGQRLEKAARLAEQYENEHFPLTARRLPGSPE